MFFPIDAQTPQARDELAARLREASGRAAVTGWVDRDYLAFTL